jgi:hypothetical protein
MSSQVLATEIRVLFNICGSNFFFFRFLAGLAPWREKSRSHAKPQRYQVDAKLLAAVKIPQE